MLLDSFFPCLVEEGDLLLVSPICLLYVLLVSDLQLFVLKLQLLLLQLGDPQLRGLSLKEVALLQTIVLVVLQHLTK